MGIPPKKISNAKTSSQKNNIQQFKITRKKQLFLLFWVAEEDKGRDFFKESAQTRLINLKTFKSFDKNIHKVHCPPLHGFTEIQKIIDNWINHYGGKEKVEVKEVSFFSHAGLDGPIIYSAETTTPVEMLEPKYKSQLKIEYWQKINFYWAKESRLNFFGCNTAYLESEQKRFARVVSGLSNTNNIVISGQPTSSFPSFYPNRRFTSVARSLVYKDVNYSPEFAWDVGPTYMVAGNSKEGKKALKLNDFVKVNRMLFYRNNSIILESDQAFFNDHRVDRKIDDGSKEYKELNRWIGNGFNK
jgi:hypothetical protein